MTVLKGQPPKEAAWRPFPIVRQKGKEWEVGIQIGTKKFLLKTPPLKDKDAAMVWHLELFRAFRSYLDGLHFAKIRAIKEELNKAGLENSKLRGEIYKREEDIRKLEREIAHLKGETYEKIREHNPEEPLT